MSLSYLSVVCVLIATIYKKIYKVTIGYCIRCPTAGYILPWLNFSISLM